MTTTEFAEVYQGGLPRTIRFLRSMGFNEDQLGDLAQTAWGRAWERLDQLRDEARIVSWVNTIALNEGRRGARASKASRAVTPAMEPVVHLNVAAIDLAKVFAMCSPEDREVLQAQLEGKSHGDFAQEKGTTATAMRIRGFRARRAARQLCESAASLAERRAKDDSQMDVLRDRFQEDRLVFAERHFGVCVTFLRLLDMTKDPHKRGKLMSMIQKGVQNVRKSLNRTRDGNLTACRLRAQLIEVEARINRYQIHPAARPANGAIESRSASVKLPARPAPQPVPYVRQAVNR